MEIEACLAKSGQRPAIKKSDEMSAVVQSLWPQLAHRLSPKNLPKAD
jgi:hypothetical protein